MVPPVQVLERHVRRALLRSGRIPAKGGALQVELFVDGQFLGPEVVHHDEADVSAEGSRDADQPVKVRQQRLVAREDMRIVVWQHAAQELRLLLGHRLDDEAGVLGQVKDGAALARRAKLAQRPLAADGDDVLLLLDPKVLAQVPEGQRRVVLELEGRGGVGGSGGGALAREVLRVDRLEVLGLQRPLPRRPRPRPPRRVRDPQLEVLRYRVGRVALEDGDALAHLAVAHALLGGPALWPGRLLLPRRAPTRGRRRSGVHHLWRQRLGRGSGGRGASTGGGLAVCGRDALRHRHGELLAL
mmetsp:Transcript_26725/g.85715  ORF Transcript_26725/g.85715 Transcript_26725/m.85715 type:complete len:300 (-) Transcript_26725:243-1142(-)